jgi:hypothetical protein
MIAVLDASSDSSPVEQPSTIRVGLSALGSLDKRRMADDPHDWNLRLAHRRPDRVEVMDPS